MTYTIIEPSFEYFDRHKDGYLKFLERCCRVCYKSEHLIAEGSAEKLLNKVVKEYKHLSVVEHESCIIEIKSSGAKKEILYEIIKFAPMFGFRFSFRSDSILLSGNIRMWLELVSYIKILSDSLWLELQQKLYEKWPFFFNKGRKTKRIFPIDDNPMTNKDNLSTEEMEKHMTLTYKLVGDRNMSHQLVRHRFCAFSQESQRYVNYSKKGFQFIVSPSIKNKKWFSQCVYLACQHYEMLLKDDVKPEDARTILPSCMKTEVITTTTLGMWKYIFKHRAENSKAQWQIRKIMQGIQKHAKIILPKVF